MQDQASVTTFKGQPLNLLGKPVKVGDTLPDVELIDVNLQPVKLSSFLGKVLILCSVPSLDTAVCDTETRRFNEEVQKLGSDFKVVTVSMDLPFAQKRWCAGAGIENVVTLSDHREASFGKAFGTLIKDWRLESRAVFLVDKKGTIRNIYYIKEMTDQPDYATILKEAQKLK